MAGSQLDPEPSATGVADVAALVDPEAWVDEYGDYLYRYALARLRDPEQAADLVQETYLAAFKAQRSFAGKSAARSWLVGILKNKVVDHFRRRSRETSFTDLEFLEDEMSGKFQAEGMFKDGWHHDRGPLEWNLGPGASLDQEAFWRVFSACRDKLPVNIARAFVLREMEDMGTEEICTVLNIKPNHLWVMLHRARMALRQCLEVNWFGDPAKGGAP